METIHQQLKKLDKHENLYQTCKVILFILGLLGGLGLFGIIASPFLFLFISVKAMLSTLGASILLIGIAYWFQNAFEYALASSMLGRYPNIAKWDVSSSQEEEKIEMLRAIQKYIRKHGDKLNEE